MSITEEELKARATAPRVTLKELEANITSINYLNVGRSIEALGDAPAHPSHGLLTLCVIVLTNGFTVVGQSACASPENFAEGIGQAIAYEDAKRQIWPLMGYALRDHLTYKGQSAWAQPAAGAE